MRQGSGIKKSSDSIQLYLLILPVLYWYETLRGHLLNRSGVYKQAFHMLRLAMTLRPIVGNV